MPRKCAKFVSQYLIPSLDTQRFGKHLKWIDKKNSIFELDWCHKGGPMWTEKEAEVFVEWDKLKGHYQPEDKQYYTKSKQRFRALLYKLTLEGQIKKLKSVDKYKKVYSIGEKKLRKKKKNHKDSSAVNGFSSNDEMSSDDKDGLMDKISWKGVSFDNHGANELNDHNYSSLSNSSYTPSDSDDQTSVHQEDSVVTTSLHGSYETPEIKVLVERNYPYSAYLDVCVPVFKDTNTLNDFLENMFLDEDNRVVDIRTPTKNEGQMQNESLYAKNIHDHILPAEILDSSHGNSLSSFIDSSSFNFEHFLFDSSTDLHLQSMQ